MRASFHLHAIHDERLIVRSLSVSSCLSFSCFSLLLTSSLPHSTCTLTCTPSMSTAPRETTAAPSPNEEYCLLAIHHLLTICTVTRKWMETRSRKGERRTPRCLGLSRSWNKGLGVPRSCAPFQLCSWERILLVWTAMTETNGRFRFQLFCLFPCWVGTKKIFP